MKKQTSIILSLSILVVAGLAALSMSSTTNATNEPITIHEYGTLPYYPMEFLAQKSVYVIKGTVAETKPVPTTFNEFGSPQIYTDVVLNVEEDLHKKYTDKQITIRMRGGISENYKIVSDSAPTFNVGENVLIFVADKEPQSVYGDNYYVAGLKLGKYSISDGIAHNVDSVRSMSEETLSAEIKRASLQNTYD